MSVHAAALVPDPATISSWPALAAYALGLAAIGYSQWRQHLATRDVKHQVHNNGGKTLKDVADRTEQGQAELQKGQDELRTMLAEHIDSEPARRRRTTLTSIVLAAVVSAAVSLVIPRR